jgi:hypothetical protein
MEKLIYYGGEGYSYSKEIGKYSVRYGETEKKFNRLSLAIKYYDSLKCEKAIWNDNTYSLLDCYVIELPEPITYADVLAYCDTREDISVIRHARLNNGGYQIWINFCSSERRYAARTPSALLIKIKSDFDGNGKFTAKGRNMHTGWPDSGF